MILLCAAWNILDKSFLSVSIKKSIFHHVKQPTALYNRSVHIIAVITGGASSTLGSTSLLDQIYRVVPSLTLGAAEQVAAYAHKVFITKWTGRLGGGHNGGLTECIQRRKIRKQS